MMVIRHEKNLTSIDLTIADCTDRKEARTFALNYLGETLERFYGSHMMVYPAQNCTVVQLWTD